MALGSIVIDLLLKTGAFNNDAKLAERRLNELSKTATRVGAALGAAIAGGAVMATTAIKSAINSMDDMSKAAMRAQVPTEEFSQLAFAAELSDVSMQDLAGSLGKLQRAQSEAADGAKTQTEAFERMGVAFKSADGTLRSSREVFLDFADAFRKQQGNPEALAAGMDIFGRSFQNLIPMLSGGREGLEAAADEADRLGITLGTQAGREAEAFNDNLTRLKGGVDGLWRSVAADLLPDLVRLTDEFVSGAMEGDRYRTVASEIADAIRGIGSVIGVAVNGFKVFQGTVRGVILDLVAVNNVATASRRAVFGDWAGAREAMQDAKLARSMAAEASADIERVFKRAPAPTGVIFAGEGAEPAGMFRKSEAEVRLEESRKAAAEASAEMRRLAEERAGAEKQSSAATKAAREAEAEAKRKLAEATREAEKSQADFDRALMEGEVARSRWLDTIEDASDRMSGPAAIALRDYKRAVMEADQALAAGSITAAEHSKYVGLLAEEHGKTVAELGKTTDAMTAYGEQAARNMQDSFADFLFDPFADGVSGMAKNFADALRRMAANVAASKLFEALGSWGTANAGNSGWAKFISSMFAGGKAEGGYTGPGGKYEPAGIVHRGEVVWSQMDVARAGGVGVVEAMRKGYSGYASGGVVGGGSFSAGAPRVEIINNGPPVRVESAQMETGAGGESLLKMVIGAVGESLNGGTLGKIGKARYGWREQV